MNGIFLFEVDKSLFWAMEIKKIADSRFYLKKNNLFNVIKFNIKQNGISLELINLYSEQWKKKKKFYIFAFVRKKKLIYTGFIYIKTQITIYERIDCYFVVSFNS